VIIYGGINMRCLIVNDELTEEECLCIQEQCYKKKNDKDLPKRVKRVIGWNAICKSCKEHKAGKRR